MKISVRTAYPLWILIALALFSAPFFARAQGITPSAGASISAEGAGQVLRFAQGQIVPLSVKLTNFGSTARTDVTVYYLVSDPTGKTIFETSETVAVETTAAYVKRIALAQDTPSGLYTAKISVTYQDQKVPAISTYQFTVERTYFGIYQSELMWYALGLGLILLVFLLLILLLMRRTHGARYVIHDYSGVAPGLRIYYELISDAIQQMRSHEGDRALALAASIPGLSVDTHTGRVTHLDEDPAHVMATLISEYHQRFNRNVNLSFTGQSASRAIVR